MSYLDDVEQELRDLYHETDKDELPDALVKLVRAKLLQSYKNGAQAARRQGQQGNQKQYKKSKTSK